MAQPRRTARRFTASPIEGFPLQVWVRAAHAAPDDRFSGFYQSFVDLAAYWLWQFRDFLNVALQQSEPLEPVLTLAVDVEESDQWFEVGNPEGNAFSITSTPGKVDVLFHPWAAALFGGPDNSGERALVRELIPAVTSAAMGRGVLGASLDGSTLDQIAPLGQKKRLVVFGGESAILLDREGLPDFRALQDAEIDAWRSRDVEILTELNAAEPRTIHDPAERRSSSSTSSSRVPWRAARRFIAATSYDA